jgi:hypothetical protein
MAQGMRANNLIFIKTPPHKILGYIRNKDIPPSKQNRSYFFSVVVVVVVVDDDELGFSGAGGGAGSTGFVSGAGAVLVSTLVVVVLFSSVFGPQPTSAIPAKNVRDKNNTNSFFISFTSFPFLIFIDL